MAARRLLVNALWSPVLRMQSLQELEQGASCARCFELARRFLACVAHELSQVLAVQGGEFHGELLQWAVAFGNQGIAQALQRMQMTDAGRIRLTRRIEGLADRHMILALQQSTEVTELALQGAPLQSAANQRFLANPLGQRQALEQAFRTFHQLAPEVLQSVMLAFDLRAAPGFLARLFPPFRFAHHGVVFTFTPRSANTSLAAAMPFKAAGKPA